MKGTKKPVIGGFPANSLLIPLAIVIAVLHFLIIVLVFQVNQSNSSLSGMMQQCSEEQQYATNLLAGSSTLSETAVAFAQIPVNADGSFNTGPLMRFVKELSRDRRGPQVAQWFRAQNVRPEVQAYIDDAAEQSEQMLKVQLHVISLLCSVYPPPQAPELAAIPLDTLSEEELAMSKEARTAYARGLMSSRDYTMLKAYLSDNIESCHRMLQTDYNRAAAKCEQRITALRTGLWLVIFSIILLMFCTFSLFYRWLILPLRTYARQIQSDQSMNQASSIREMRLVVNAYNALLRRHDKLETILRSAAETDALTELPNRCSLEHYLLESSESNGAMAALLFDVNYLKHTNDTMGHLAGDLLLRTAGACIRECFETEKDGSCYRIGGDEFAAILRNCSEEEVQARIRQFARVQEREKISVAVGYAFSETSDETSFKKLMKLADERMYEQKKRIHEQSRGAIPLSLRRDAGAAVGQSS